MNDLKGKVAVVTGASKGIGAAIAKGLSAAGAAVVVNYSSSKEGADRVVADIKTKGGRAIAVRGDVAKAADVRRLFDHLNAMTLMRRASRLPASWPEQRTLFGFR
jgi:3-oxoacyl-[acyl-carrier protein] reductase